MSVKKLFYSFLILGIVLQSIIFYMFLDINKKSDQMNFHKTEIISKISDIKYNLSEIHLWIMEYMAGDKQEKIKLKKLYLNIEKDFTYLIKLESANRYLHTLKYRDHEYVVDSLNSLKTDFLKFKELTNKNITNVGKTDLLFDVEYDSTYENTIKKLNIFNSELNKIFNTIFKEFDIYKNSVYILMIFLVLVSLIIFYLISIREAKRIKEREESARIIEIQSRDASMGAMMDAIAHQWKQPLSIMGMSIQNLEMKIEFGESISDDEIIEVSKSSQEQISHLVSTIDEFRDFFRPNQIQKIVSIKKIVDSTLSLMKNELVSNNMKCEILGDFDIEISCIPNEFKHVFINLINNSKDAFNENDIKDRKIIIETTKNKNDTIINISDNAGGVPEDIIDKIFISNFTTKDNGKGTSVGLYLTKQIIEKLDASISVKNIENGVCFTILFPLSK